MELVDEENDVAGRRRLGHDRAKTLLVLAAIRRSREQPHVIERQQPNVAHDERHVLRRDALRQAFRDRRLADTGRSDEGGIVLSVTQQDVDDARDFVFTTSDRLEAAGARVSGEVAREARECAAGGFGSEEVAAIMREAGRRGREIRWNDRSRWSRWSLAGRTRRRGRRFQE